MPWPEISILLAVFLFGGVIKGALGIGLPTYLIACLTFFYEPRVAVAMILFVIMATNVRQAMVGGSIWDIIWRHRYYCAFASVGIFIVSTIGARVPVSYLLTLVGLAIVIFSLNGLFARIPLLPPKYDAPVQIITGIGSGILGGLTAIWGPPLAIYLMSIRLERDKFIQTLGVMFSVQSVFLISGFIVSGELTSRIAMIGAAALIPTFIGMYFGERLRKRMNTEQFMRAFLIVFLMLGLNLIRRGLTSF